MPRSAPARVEVAGIALSSPDKVLWQPQGLTKRDLAAYYVAMADRILPHVAGRPLTLLRCPSGAEGACFIQKHAWPGLGAAVRRVRTGDGEWLAVDDLSGLIALVQMGVLELHPWGSRTDDPERPDRIVLDLDPEDGVHWAHVAEGAREIRAALDALGLRSFVKTTGGKGLHVVVPIEPAPDWEAAKDFAHAVAAQLAERRPERYTTNPLKEARAGRIFLDHLRNSRGATAVAAWSPRARPGAPVAVPLSWDELDSPDRPGVSDLPAWAERRQQDPWRDFFTVRQRLPG